MYASPKNMSIREFIPGSSNLHPCPLLHVNFAGPFIISRKKSSMSSQSFISFRGTSKQGPVLTQTSVLSTYEPPRNAATLDLFAVIQRCVGVVPRLIHRCAFRQPAIERLDLPRPKLKRASGVLLPTAESYFRRTVGKHIQDLPVFNGKFIDVPAINSLLNALVTSQIW